MKVLFKIFALGYFVILTISVQAQNQWAFLKGYLYNGGEVFGQHSGPNNLNPSNKPGSREHCGSAISDGKIWIFGGAGYTSGSDLWYYDTKLKAWAFVSDKGNNEQYIHQGIESTVAHPGNRSRMASAIDKDGYLWVFGGATYDLGFHTAWSDLWKYNPKTNKWTWIGGPTSHTNNGSYNQIGVPDWPRARYRHRGWFDEDNNFWIFGGVFYDGATYTDPLNDLWKFNLKTGVWTCESGDCNVKQSPATPGGVYPPSVGMTSVNYKPRARSDYGYWRDNDGNFWIYGGNNGEAHSVGEALGDTWKYNPKTHEWTLMANEIDYSDTLPWKNIEPLTWLGNDGLPWMRLTKNSIWKFNQNNWVLQKAGTADFATPFVENDVAYQHTNSNRPGSHFTTFCNIKDDSLVYLFNGYGVGYDNFLSYTGALWGYSLEQFQQPKLSIQNIADDFDAAGSSSYNSSVREFKIKNIGADTAHFVSISLGSNLKNDLTAMNFGSLSIIDEDSVSIPYTITDTVLYEHPFTLNTNSCGFQSNVYYKKISLTLPKIPQGKSFIIREGASHCMANFNHPGFGALSWNVWELGINYKNKFKKKKQIVAVNADSLKSLQSYNWKKYEQLIINDLSNPNVFVLEIGSGKPDSLSANQDLGSAFNLARVRLDITLPQNISLNSGSISDIVGEYALITSNSLIVNQVSPNFITYGLTNTGTGSQPLSIYFPPGRYLPLRKIKISLRSKTQLATLPTIPNLIRTTFNHTFATDGYGWKANPF
jgi:hypothetical protein